MTALKDPVPEPPRPDRPANWPLAGAVAFVFLVTAAVTDDYSLLRARPQTMIVEDCRVELRPAPVDRAGLPHVVERTGDAPDQAVKVIDACQHDAVARWCRTVFGVETASCEGALDPAAGRMVRMAVCVTAKGSGGRPAITLTGSSADAEALGAELQLRGKGTGITFTGYVVLVPADR